MLLQRVIGTLSFWQWRGLVPKRSNNLLRLVDCVCSELFFGLLSLLMAGLLQAYQYASLTEPHSIRLMHLYPARGVGETIVGELFEAQTYPIHEVGHSLPTVQYEALSWTWGTDKWEDSIKIRTPGRDSRLKVPPNLVAALKELRNLERTRTIWVDAICINQNDTPEKNRQVNIMSEIYSAATRVCVWLGPADADSTWAMSFMKYDLLQLQDFDKLYEDKEAIMKWHALLKLMKRPWFSRRWVVQEIVMARDAMIYCGSDSLPWTKFAETVQLFLEIESVSNRFTELMQSEDTRPRFHREYISSLGASLLVDATTGTFFRFSKNGLRQPLISLEYLVSSLAGFQVSEPRDCIYSLLAIAKNTHRVDARDDVTSPPARRASFQPHTAEVEKQPYKVDYDLPFVDVCKEFIMFAIQHSDPTRALDVLCRPWAPTPKTKSASDSFGRSDTTEEPDLPSWIPTLNRSAFALFTLSSGGLKLGRKNADPLVGLPHPSPAIYNVADGLEVDIATLRFKKGAIYHSIFVSGFILDKVDNVATAPFSGILRAQWLTMGGWTDGNTAPPEELWRTLVANRHSSGKTAPTYYSRALQEAAKLRHKEPPLRSLDTTKLINMRLSSAMSEFLRRVQAVTWSRTMIRTKSGDLGIAPRDAKSGDLVCILYGCSVPVILRRKRKEEEEENEESTYNMEVQKAAIWMQQRWRMRRSKKVAIHTRAEDEDTSRSIKEGTVNSQQNSFNSDLASERKAQAATSLPPDLTSTKNQRPKPNTKSPTPSSDLTQDLHTPKLLTEEDKFYYEFIGECYIHGMMEGDAIKHQKDQGIKPQVFELR